MQTGLAGYNALFAKIGDRVASAVRDLRDIQLPFIDTTSVTEVEQGCFMPGSTISRREVQYPVGYRRLLLAVCDGYPENNLQAGNQRALKSLEELCPTQSPTVVEDCQAWICFFENLDVVWKGIQTYHGFVKKIISKDLEDLPDNSINKAIFVAGERLHSIYPPKIETSDQLKKLIQQSHEDHAARIRGVAWMEGLLTACSTTLYGPLCSISDGLEVRHRLSSNGVTNDDLEKYLRTNPLAPSAEGFQRIIGALEEFS